MLRNTILSCFVYHKKNTKENKIQLKLIKNLCIFKLFIFYREEKNKLNEFEEACKNNLLTLNLFFICLHFFFHSIFPLYFLFLTCSLKIFKNPT